VRSAAISGKACSCLQVRCCTRYRGKRYHAAVEGGDILFDGRKVTPSEFVHAPGGAARNAWQLVWILFPNEAAWLLGAILRAPCRAPAAVAA